MGKHKKREEGIKGFKLYEEGELDGDLYYKTIYFTDKVEAKKTGTRTMKYKRNQARLRFINKYNQWKLLDNTFMKKKIRKRKTDKEINDFIDNLTEEEKKIIIREHIKGNEKEKSNSTYDDFSITKIAFIKNVHRTTLYKKAKTRTYKFDGARATIEDTFYENHGFYGSKRLAIVLKRKGININDRSLRRYMIKGNLVTKTRKARRKSESKNTAVKYADLVKRNFNPDRDNIVATDVSYIPANVKQNNVYLSVAISHKTKLIESGKISSYNDNQLVIDTLNDLKRKKKFILHSDHGSQYSSERVKENVNKKYEISMGRIGNSLDNREAEYFFGCLKGEYLKNIKTGKMSQNEIEKHISGYINGYNTKRIQKRLQGKVPTSVSTYAI